MDGKLRVGFLCTARICIKNALAIQKSDNCELTVVGSRNVEKASAFISDMQKQGAAAQAQAVGSYQAVVDHEAVDCVYIPLPTSLHLEWVEKAVAKGKHVLLEKPVTLNDEDLDKLTHLARENSHIQVMDGTMWSHNPRTAVMREEICKLGDIKRVNVSISFVLQNADSNIRGQKDLDGLGALGDIGWYACRAMLWVRDYQKPSSVRAHAFPKYNDGGVVISCGATLLWEDGAVGNFDVSFDTCYRMNLEVAGTEAALTCKDFMLPFDDKMAQYDVRVNKETTSHTVHTAKSQAALMWDEMAKCCSIISAGGTAETRWLELMESTQRVVNAVMKSLDREGAVVRLE